MLSTTKYTTTATTTTTRNNKNKVTMTIMKITTPSFDIFQINTRGQLALCLSWLLVIFASFATGLSGPNVFDKNGAGQVRSSLIYESICENVFFLSAD
jgi:hypothetical protein